MTIKICFWGFFGLLITNPLSDFQKLRWRIQYGGRKIERISNFYPNLVYGALWCRLLQICRRIFKIQDCRPSTADKSRKITQFKCKLVFQVFLSCWLLKNKKHKKNKKDGEKTATPIGVAVYFRVARVNLVYCISWQTSSPVYHKWNSKN